MDSNVQKALRLSDPGLPLLPVLKSVKGLSFDLQSVNLNANSMSFPGLILSGHWDADEEKIWTKDVDAQLSFRSAGSEVSILREPRITRTLCLAWLWNYAVYRHTMLFVVNTFVCQIILS